MKQRLAVSRECGNTHVSDKVMFVKFDGVLYAVYEQSEAYARWKFQHLQADAYFKRMEESDVLKEHHALALQLLERMPKEQADMFLWYHRQQGLRHNQV